jgi:transposase
VDAAGRPLRLAISGRQLHDSQMTDAFLDWDIPPLAIVADKAYGSGNIRQQIADEGALAVIPSKSNARQPILHDAHLYAKRNIVERFFCKMKDMRRLATRFEKKARNFLSMVQIFAIRCWANCVHTLVVGWPCGEGMTAVVSEYSLVGIMPIAHAFKHNHQRENAYQQCRQQQRN